MIPPPAVQKQHNPTIISAYGANIISYGVNQVGVKNVVKVSMLSRLEGQPLEYKFQGNIKQMAVFLQI